MGEKVKGLSLSGEYVEALNVKKFTIVDVPKYITIKYTENGKEVEKEVLQITVKLHENNSIKEWLPNKTTITRLAALWGDDLDNWLNKEAEFKIVEMNVFGQTKKVIKLKE